METYENQVQEKLQDGGKNFNNSSFVLHFVYMQHVQIYEICFDHEIVYIIIKSLHVSFTFNLNIICRKR